MGHDAGSPFLGFGRAPPVWPDHPLLLPSVIAVGKILCPQGTSCARSLGVGAVSQSGRESSWHFCGPQFGRGGSRRRRRVGRRDRGTISARIQGGVWVEGADAQRGSGSCDGSGAVRGHPTWGSKVL